jgi:hypothetical protein
MEVEDGTAWLLINVVFWSILLLIAFRVAVAVMFAI